MQAQPRRVEFVPEPHTDFIFAVEGPIWPLALAAIGLAAVALGLALRWRGRRRRDAP
jgi:cell division protein FtsW (lipid II flippase)